MSENADLMDAAPVCLYEIGVIIDIMELSFVNVSLFDNFATLFCNEDKTGSFAHFIFFWALLLLLGFHFCLGWDQFVRVVLPPLLLFKKEFKCPLFSFVNK